MGSSGSWPQTLEIAEVTRLGHKGSNLLLDDENSPTAQTPHPIGLPETLEALKPGTPPSANPRLWKLPRLAEEVRQPQNMERRRV